MMITNYIREMGIVELEDAEQIELLKEYRDGDELAKEKLVESMFEMLIKLSRRFEVRGGVDSEVYFQKSFEHVYKALDTFDFERGSRVSSHVAGYVEKRFLDTLISGIKGDGDMLRDGVISGAGNKRARVNKIKDFRESFSEEFGYHPSVSEISDGLGYKEGTIIDDLRIDETIDVGSQLDSGNEGGDDGDIVDIFDVYINEDERDVFDIVNDNVRVKELMEEFEGDDFRIIEDMLDRTQNDGKYTNGKLNEEFGSSNSNLYRMRDKIKIDLIKSRSPLYKKEVNKILGMMNRRERKCIEYYLKREGRNHLSIAKKLSVSVEDVKKLIAFYDREIESFVEENNEEIMYDIMYG